jgi:hypothetical protein
MLCSLVASPLADQNQPRYRKELAKIADGPTLNLDVRLSAAMMLYRTRRAR